MSLKLIAYLLCWCNICATLAGQSLQVKDFAQIFQPALSFGGEWTPPRPIKGSSAMPYQGLSVGLQASIPISGKIEFDLNLDKLKNWKNIKSWKDKPKNDCWDYH